MDRFMRNYICLNLLARELGLVELDHVFHDVDCYLYPSFWLGKGGFSLHQYLLWDFSCLIKSVYIIYFINFFTIHLLDKVVIDEKVKLTHVKYGQFSWKFPCLKWYEKCDLKSDVKTCIYRYLQSKKCVWYHDLNNMF